MDIPEVSLSWQEEASAAAADPHCFVYNLGADDQGGMYADDDGYGPPLRDDVAKKHELMRDSSDFTRVKRISRWTRW
ncbi:hypothetical protein WME91_39635 [Sorangium sp. So ce269]